MTAIILDERPVCWQPGFFDSGSDPHHVLQSSALLLELFF